MQYEQYVEEGRQALQQEESAGWKLAELAAGVEREHGALTRWAESIGLSARRAYNLRQAWDVKESVGVKTTTPSFSVSVAEELHPMPIPEREQFLANNQQPSMRKARAAAEPYRKTKPLAEKEEQAIEAIMAPADRAVRSFAAKTGTVTLIEQAIEEVNSSLAAGGLSEEVLSALEAKTKELLSCIRFASQMAGTKS